MHDGMRCSVGTGECLWVSHKVLCIISLELFIFTVMSRKLSSAPIGLVSFFTLSSGTSKLVLFLLQTRKNGIKNP